MAEPPFPKVPISLFGWGSNVPPLSTWVENHWPRITLLCTAQTIPKVLSLFWLPLFTKACRLEASNWWPQAGSLVLGDGEQ